MPKKTKRKTRTINVKLNLPNVLARPEGWTAEMEEAPGLRLLGFLVDEVERTNPELLPFVPGMRKALARLEAKPKPTTTPDEDENVGMMMLLALGTAMQDDERREQASWTARAPRGAQ